MKNLGFTLLEVLVAIAILGLGLTGILGAETGAFSSAARAEHMSVATDLVRCKMAETELKLVQMGFPLTDESYEGACCEEEDQSTYTCEWTVDRVKLPELLSTESAANGDSAAPNASSTSSSELGPLGVLADIQKSKGASLGDKPSVESLTEQVGESAGGIQGMTQMLFGFVYPSFKPLLEASIRKITVTVKWKEGKLDRDLTVSQYFTDPQKGGFEGEIDGQPGTAASGSSASPFPSSTARSLAPQVGQ